MNLINLKKKKSKFSPIKTPKNIELEYYRNLKFIVEQIHQRFKNNVIEPLNKNYIKEQIVDESISSKMKRLIAEFNRKINKQFDIERINEISRRLQMSTYYFNEKRWQMELEKFGIDLTKDMSWSFLKDYLQMRINNNVGLITSLKENVSASLEKMIYANFEKGKTFTELAKEMSNRLGIDKRKAMLIARNEIKNTNTQMNKKRMQDYGVEYAIWDTAEDERVRIQHAHFQGKKYKIGKGLKNSKGEYEEPGEAINCRCIAMPVI